MRHTRILAATMIALFTSSAAHAVVLLDDDFDTENGGVTALGYTGFANFTVDGTVDLLADGAFGVQCAGGTGACVDLTGSAGDSRFNTLYYNFNAGDEIILTALVSGSQRDPGVSDPLQFGFEFIPNIDLTDLRYVASNGFINEPGVVFTNIGGIFTANVPVPSNLPFTQIEFRFTALDDGQVRAVFDVESDNAVGPVLDNVRIELIPSADVPAPAALALFGLGIAALCVARRR